MAGPALRTLAQVVLLPLLLTGCTAMSPARPGAALQPANQVTLEARSWGRILSGWSVGPEGEGAWYTRENEDGTLVPFGPYRITYRSFDAGPAGAAALAGQLVALPDPVPDFAACENFMTDQVYGILRVTRGASTAETAWNEGCMDSDYAAFMDRLRAANTLVESWAASAPVERIVRYSEDGAIVSE